MVVPVIPLDQITIPSQLFPVKVTLSPEQILSFPQVTTGGAGLGVTITVTVLAPSQVVPVVHVAVYVVVVAGLTVIVTPVAPVFHFIDPEHPPAVSIEDAP